MLLELLTVGGKVELLRKMLSSKLLKEKRARWWSEPMVDLAINKAGLEKVSVLTSPTWL